MDGLRGSSVEERNNTIQFGNTVFCILVSICDIIWYPLLCGRGHLCVYSLYESQNMHTDMHPYVIHLHRFLEEAPRARQDGDVGVYEALQAVEGQGELGQDEHGLEVSPVDRGQDEGREKPQTDDHSHGVPARIQANGWRGKACHATAGAKASALCQGLARVPKDAAKIVDRILSIVAA